MASVRWRKLRRDLWTERARVAAMIAAIAVSLSAVGVVLGGYAILTREIATNYLGTHPASATLELPDGVDRALVEEVRRDPAVAAAEAREMILSRVRVGDAWRPLLLFVVDDFATLGLDSFRPERGAWPPPDGTMLLERTAVPVLGAGPGDHVTVRLPGAAPVEVPVSGVVHDPGLAPAWQERAGYGYVSRATLAGLDPHAVVGELRVVLRDRPHDRRAIEAGAAALAQRLIARGHAVRQIRVAPPGQHPHQRQMTTILILMLSFSAMALVLSAVLVATSLAAMLARQVREIGVMKSVGARTAQIAGMYAALVVAIGAVAAAIALPLGVVGARAMATSISHLLNFAITSDAIPAWVFLTVGAAAIVVPLALAAIPIARAARLTVRAAIDEHGVAAAALTPRIAALPRVARELVRRPARLALAVGLLAAAGAMFLTARNVAAGWDANLAKVDRTRRYDLEVLLATAQPPALAERVGHVPGVRAVERWGHTETAFARPGVIDVVHGYPDGRHGSLALLAPPADTVMIRLPVRGGRWLTPGDTDAVVLNLAAAAQAPGLRIGDPVALSIDGRATTWRLVGLVEEVGAAGVAYVTDQAFARVAGTGDRARLLRLTIDPSGAAVERLLDEAGVAIAAVTPRSELRAAVGDHMAVLVRMLLALAVIMAVVGTLGLASVLGVSVLERTRELGVMRALGATRARLVRRLVVEAVAIAGLSWLVALALALPLTLLVDGVIGRLGFVAPLPFVVTHGAPLVWLAIVLGGALVATIGPAIRVTRVSVRDALATL